MNAEVFIDTNVFLYAISDRPEEQSKTHRARNLLLNQNWGWSVQIAGEFFSTAVSTKRPFQIATDRAAEYLQTWLNFPTASITPMTVKKAVEIQQRFRVNYWDATVIAAALELECHTLYTEDLNHGQHYEMVEVVNPFLDVLPI